MTSVSFDLTVTYSQIALFDPSLQNPFNDWRPQHVAQRFSWRPESVSFGTLQEGGVLRVEVRLVKEIGLRADAKRAILVPFSVGPSGLIEVAGLDTGKQVNVPEGNYALVFETGYNDDDTMWCRLTFVPSDSVQAEILRADSEMSPSSPLLMEARPA